MSSIYVFPGQGAQAVGMGLDLYQNNADNLPLNFAFASLEEAQGNKEKAKKYLQNILLKDKKNALALRRIKSII